MSSTDNNHIKNVAIVGASGHIGSTFLRALLTTNTHNAMAITALTRASNTTSTSTATFPPGVAVARIDYSDFQSLVSVLRGQDFLIITLTHQPGSGTHRMIVKAAVEAGVRWIMPNYYGFDYRNKVLREEELGMRSMYENVVDVEELCGGHADEEGNKGSRYVTMVCGFWYEWSLALGEPFFGFDVQGRKVTFFDEGRARVRCSTWEHCGRAVAALLSLPITSTSTKSEIEDENENDNGAKKHKSKTPVLQDFSNAPLLISSFHISQVDILASLHRVLGTSDADWDITYESTEKRVKDGMEEMARGQRTGFAKAMYSRIFFGNGDAEFRGEVGNGMLGLDDKGLEGLDEATRRAVGMVEGGWRP